MRKKIKYKSLAVLFAAALALLIIPMLAAGFYAVPCADDFSYGTPAHLAYMQTGSVAAALLAGAGKVTETYMSWQGSFSAVFLMAMQPAVFSESLYALTPAVMLTALLAGVFSFCFSLLCGVFGMKKSVCVIAASVICVLCTQLVPSPVQGFYWYNGAVYYVAFYGLSLLCMALCINYIRRGGAARLVCACVLAAFVGGGNYVTALSCSIIGVGAIAGMAFFKNGAWKKLLLPTLLLLISFAVSIAAPGNAGRRAALPDTPPGAVEAILLSFKSFSAYCMQWFKLPLAASLLFLSPMLWYEASAAAFQIRYPLLITAGSYCLLSAMFCPPIYAMGSVGDFRLINIIYFAYVLLLVLNIFSWMVWAAGKRTNRPKREAQSLLLTAGLAAVVLLCCFVITNSSFTSVSALGMIRSGEAQEYADCAERRFELLHDSSISDPELEPFPCQPYLLFCDDISTDPEDWRNIDMSHYYGKNTVRLAP